MLVVAAWRRRLITDHNSQEFRDPPSFPACQLHDTQRKHPEDWNCSCHTLSSSDQLSWWCRCRTPPPTHPQHPPVHADLVTWLYLFLWLIAQNVTLSDDSMWWAKVFSLKVCSEREEHPRRCSVCAHLAYSLRWVAHVAGRLRTA